MTQKIWVIIAEDDPVSAFLIRKTAESLQYGIGGVCEDGARALNTANDSPFHLAIIDINLSGNMDGLQLARQMQMIYHPLLIFVSSYSNEEVIKEALTLFPVAYLVKPVKNADMKAAMMLAEQLLCRRSSPARSQSDWIDLPASCRYNKTSRLLLREALPVELTPLEKKLLALLIRHQGSCVSSDQIIKSLWNRSDMAIDPLRSLIRRFHQKLGRDLIVNVYAKGYKIDLLSTPFSFDI